MNTKAFVLIETAPGMNQAVLYALRRLDGVNSVDQVTGVYDIIAVVEADGLSALGNLVTAEIRRTDGISRIVTCLIAPSPAAVG